MPREESDDVPRSQGDYQVPLLADMAPSEGTTSSSDKRRRSQSSNRRPSTQGGTFEEDPRLSTPHAHNPPLEPTGSATSSFANGGLSFLDDMDEESSAAMYDALAKARRGIAMNAVRQSLVAFLLTPFVGTIYIGIGLQERKRRLVTMNPSDWKVLCWIGFCAQASLFAPLTNLISADARNVLVDKLHTEADFLGPFVVFGAMSLYLTSTVIGYIAYSTKQRIASYERPRDAVVYMARKQQPASARRRGDLLESIERIKLQIQEDTTLPTWVVIIISCCVGFCQMLTLRVCRWSELSNIDPTICDADIWTFTAPGFGSVYYHIASSFWLLTFTALTATIFLALMLYYQQLRHIERFTYFTKGRRAAAQGGGVRAADAGGAWSPESPTSARRDRTSGDAFGSGNFSDSYYGTSPTGSPITSPLGSPSNRKGASMRLKKKQLEVANDLFSPKNLSLWVSVWKELLRDLRERPSMQAMTLSTVISCIMCGGTTITYVLFDNIYEGSAVAEFTGGCISVFIFCCSALGGFLFITVRLQYVVDYQVKGISETQTNVQRQLDAEMRQVGEQMEFQKMDLSGRGAIGETDALRFKMLRAKVNVLQALDTVLRTSESKPKLLGMSLETIRWSIIMIGLAVMNVAFFVLYRTKCGS